MLQLLCRESHRLQLQWQVRETYGCWTAPPIMWIWAMVSSLDSTPGAMLRFPQAGPWPIHQIWVPNDHNKTWKNYPWAVLFNKCVGPRFDHPTLQTLSPPSPTSCLGVCETIGPWSLFARGIPKRLSALRRSCSWSPESVALPSAAWLTTSWTTKSRPENHRKSNWIRFFFCPLNQWYHGDAFKKNMGYRGAIEQSCAGEQGRHTGPAELQIQGGTEPADQRFQAQEARWHRFDGKSEIVGPWRSVSQEVLPAASQRKLQGDMGGQGMCENHYIYIYIYSCLHFIIICCYVLLNLFI